MQQASPLRQLAHAMLTGASFGCQQTREGCYWSEVGRVADGTPVYAFCAIGCANLGLIGHVPQYLIPQIHRFGMTPLGEELGVNWDMPVYLPDGSRDTLSNTICHLNDHKCWSTVCIATWLLLLDAGWTVEGGSVCWREDCGQPLLLDLQRYREVVAAIERTYGRDPRHPTWEHVADPTWWASRVPMTDTQPGAGSAIP